MYILRCVTCQTEYKAEPGRYVCDHCDSIYGTLEVIYPLETIKVEKNFDKRAGIFQFGALLPVSSHTALDAYIGGTPLIELKNKLNQDKLLIKNDGMNFSGSYKDRASIIAINKAIEEGNDHIFCASTGNAASSLALLSAHTNLKTTIFVPKKIPSGKLAQLTIAGADIFPIDASYDEVFDISLEIGLKENWYTRNSAINPYLLEGKKTCAFEIIVQNDYKVPDYVLVGVGDGTIISSLCKGFDEFYSLGLIDKVPKLVGVQAKNASTLLKVFSKKPYKHMVEEVDTIADSISVGNPRDVIKACHYLEKNQGMLISVSDDDIINAIEVLANETGVFSEPAGAVTVAGLLKLQKSIVTPSDSVCLIITGNGLKDISAVKHKNIKTYTKEEVRHYFEKRSL